MRAKMERVHDMNTRLKQKLQEKTRETLHEPSPSPFFPSSAVMEIDASYRCASHVPPMLPEIDVPSFDAVGAFPARRPLAFANESHAAVAGDDSDGSEESVPPLPSSRRRRKTGAVAAFVASKRAAAPLAAAPAPAAVPDATKRTSKFSLRI